MLTWESQRTLPDKQFFVANIFVIQLYILTIWSDMFKTNAIYNNSKVVAVTWYNIDRNTPQ